MTPCWAFYDWRGTGFLMYQDAKGNSVAEGECALRRWREIGSPYVHDYGHAVQLGIVQK